MIAPIDFVGLASGLSQLNKYLSRSWYRAGLPQQVQEDCSQAVYTTLLQNLGRDRFESLLSEVGHWGVKEVFSRETTEGLDFFRAIDMVKKRAQRERVHQPLDAIDVATSSIDAETQSWRDSLQEAINNSLSPREASLINETLKADPSRNRPALGRRSQDGQQREDPRHPEASRRAPDADGRLIDPPPKPLAAERGLP